jgi:hypothetical protein
MVWNFIDIFARCWMTRLRKRNGRLNGNVYHVKAARNTWNSTAGVISIAMTRCLIAALANMPVGCAPYTPLMAYAIAPLANYPSAMVAAAAPIIAISVRCSRMT